uniref:Uncharacterized protein n=1 Tax=Rhizophora mucronata TaxID=61149 RepID=A0A2P2N6N4_RHIMU
MIPVKNRVADLQLVFSYFQHIFVFVLFEINMSVHYVLVFVEVPIYATP